MSRVTSLQGLMIVAHPDDEIIWGESALIKTAFNWTVVVVTSESNHRDRLARRVAAQNGHRLEIWGYADCSQCLPFKKATRDTSLSAAKSDIQSELYDLVTQTDWEMIVSHDALGVYGHPQHKALHRMLLKIVPKEIFFVFAPVWRSGYVRNSSLWQIYEADRPGLRMNYGSYIPRIEHVKDYNYSYFIRQCWVHFPWDCAMFDCEQEHFPESQRCGLRRVYHDIS